MGFLQTLNGLLIIVIMVLVGYICGRQNWINDKNAALMPLLVNRVALPTYMIWNFSVHFSRDEFFHLVNGFPAPFLSILLCYFLAGITGRVFKIPPLQFGVFRAVFFRLRQFL